MKGLNLVDETGELNSSVNTFEAKDSGCKENTSSGNKSKVINLKYE